MISRAVTAEVRAQLSARKLSLTWLANEIGLKKAYFTIRMRDERPLNLDEVDLIAHSLGLEADELIALAMDRQSEQLLTASMEEQEGR